MTDEHGYTEGGDPVCWLNRVCDECGAFHEDTASAVCARCGTPFPDAGPLAASRASSHDGHGTESGTESGMGAADDAE